MEEGTTIVRTACPAHCGTNACGILAHVKDGKIIKIEPADFPDPKYRRICLRGLSSLDITYHKDRLKYPMRRTGERGEGKFERISWDDALDTIAARFEEIAAKYGWKGIGWALGGPGTGTTKFAVYLMLASLTKSTYVSFWGYGDAAVPCGSRALFGTQLPQTLLEWPDPELLIVWGANPAETAPMTHMRTILDAKDKGSQIVVIDPRFTLTASKADEYIGIRPGTDTALVLGLIHVVFKNKLENRDFIHRHTVGPYLVKASTGEFLREKDLIPNGTDDYMVWDTTSKTPENHRKNIMNAALTGAYKVNGLECKPAFQLLIDLVEEYPPERVADLTGIPAATVTKFAERISSAHPVSFMTIMGFSRTFYGDVSTRAIGTLAAVTGKLHLTSAAGHRPIVLNWRGFLPPNPKRPEFSRMPVMQLYDAAISGKPYPVKAIWIAFTNLLNQCANNNKIVDEVFPNLEFIVNADLFMTPTAKYADILLPVCSYLEFSDVLMTPYPYLQLQQKVIEPLYESRSDATIVSELARRLGFGEHFDKQEEGFVELMLSSGHPSVENITLKKLKQGPVPAHMPEAVPSAEELKFSTASGKIEFYSEDLRKFDQALPVYTEPLEASGNDSRYPLTFIQGHTRFLTHSMFANSPTLLELNPEPLLEMNPVDAESRGISDGQTVTVFNDRGKATLKARLTDGLLPGVINLNEGWWPNQFIEGHTNALTHDVINPAQEMIFEPNMAMNDVAVEVIKAEP
ncbi:molybdopterin-dependent oxidoreductase [Thermodesulfobacteriota bacterium]